jgi:hypothetical protein
MAHVLKARAIAGDNPRLLEWGWLHDDYRAPVPRRWHKRLTVRFIRRRAARAIAEGLRELDTQPEPLPSPSARQQAQWEYERREWERQRRYTDEWEMAGDMEVAS